MGIPVDFIGANQRFGAPPGREEDVGSLSVFMNGTCIVSAWRLSDEEWAEVEKSRVVFLSQMAGTTLFPHYIGSERIVRAIVADYGRIW